MAGRARSRVADSRHEWEAQINALQQPSPPRPRKPAITVGRIVAAAFAIVERDGYETLTMRRLAAALETGPASLYAHVRNKDELDGLLVGALSRELTLPAPDPARWRSQVLEVCGQLRDQYLRYPGIARAALSAAPIGLDALRVSEGLLAIVLAGGVTPRDAAWAIDATLLYVGAYCLEASLHQDSVKDTDGRVVDRTELVQRLRMLPTSHFPYTVEHAEAISAGEGHDRFDFTVELMLRGLTTPSAR